MSKKFKEPNQKLLIAVLAYVASLVLPHWLAMAVYLVAILALGSWAYDGITKGDTPFRRFVGFLGMLLAINMTVHFVFY
jgi:hypothetical protein